MRFVSHEEFANTIEALRKNVDVALQRHQTNIWANMFALPLLVQYLVQAKVIDQKLLDAAVDNVAETIRNNSEIPASDERRRDLEEAFRAFFRYGNDGAAPPASRLPKLRLIPGGEK